LTGTGSLLAYQMMIESELFRSMVTAANAENYYIASSWIQVYLHYLQVDEGKFPHIPDPPKTKSEFQAVWREYFFKLLTLLVRELGIKMDQIRQKYRRDEDIPRIG
jgi:hypothetical protein